MVESSGRRPVDLLHAIDDAVFIINHHNNAFLATNKVHVTALHISSVFPRNKAAALKLCNKIGPFGATAFPLICCLQESDKLKWRERNPLTPPPRFPPPTPSVHAIIFLRAGTIGPFSVLASIKAFYSLIFMGSSVTVLTLMDRSISRPLFGFCCEWILFPGWEIKGRKVSIFNLRLAITGVLSTFCQQIILIVIFLLPGAEATKLKLGFRERCHLITWTDEWLGAEGREGSIRIAQEWAAGGGRFLGDVLMRILQAKEGL